MLEQLVTWASVNKSNNGVVNDFLTSPSPPTCAKHIRLIATVMFLKYSYIIMDHKVAVLLSSNGVIWYPDISYRATKLEFEVLMFISCKRHHFWTVNLYLTELRPNQVFRWFSHYFKGIKSINSPSYLCANASLRCGVNSPFTTFVQLFIIVLHGSKTRILQFLHGGKLKAWKRFECNVKSYVLSLSSPTFWLRFLLCRIVFTDLPYVHHLLMTEEGIVSIWYL